MPRRRSHYRKNYAVPLVCPHCRAALSRLSGQRYRIHTELEFVRKATQQKHTPSQCPSPLLEPNLWMEEFYCAHHGRIWMVVERVEDGKLSIRLPTAQCWKRAVGAHELEHNPCVGEFTWLQSRTPKIGP